MRGKGEYIVGKEGAGGRKEDIVKRGGRYSGEREGRYNGEGGREDIVERGGEI